MTRTLTVKQYLLEQLNRRARERGEDVELVFERREPRLATDRGEIVSLRTAGRKPIKYGHEPKPERSHETNPTSS